MKWRYSQQDLADRLTAEAARQGDNQTVCDVRMVRRWEKGDVIWPQEKYRMLLEKVFGRSATELGFVHRWTRTSGGWTLVTLTPDHRDCSGGERRAAERTCFGAGPISVAIPLRRGVVQRERALIAAEDAATADEIDKYLAGQGFTSVRTTVSPDATELPPGDAVVVCGPKSAPVGALLLDRDPCLGMIEEQGRWLLLDRVTGQRYPSPSDAPDYLSRDIAYCAQHVIDGRVVLHIAGIHAIGSLGMAHYLADNATDLFSTFDNKPFSLVAACDYDGFTITNSALFLGPYCWEDA